VAAIAGSGFGDTDGSRGWMAHAWLLEAVARDALGEAAAAEDALEHALGLAESGVVLVPFLFHRAPELLGRHARHCPAHAALISRILTLLAQGAPGAFGGTGSPAEPEGSSPRAITQIAQPLSEAEIRVLRYLPRDLSVPEIAGQLSLSVNTIRTHMRHIYDKLQAHRRRDVVARARTLGLLAPR
jgi:LuxR family maltose regulon positive regulatory protein